MKRYTILLLISAFCASIYLNAQTSKVISPTIPTSPQAEAIKKHGDISISYFYGIPDISIPLYEINHRGYNLPITLKYYPHTFKPGYNYDVFGHGWSLSVNSCISRTIEYAPDECHGLNHQGFKVENLSESPTNFNKYIVGHYQGIENYFFHEYLTDYNWGHDKFSATLPDGSSFEFIMNCSNNSGIPDFYITNGRRLKMSCVANNENIYSFTVIDENGIKYTFSDGDTPYYDTQKYNSRNVSWMLTQIDLPNSNEPIRFTYNHVLKARLIAQISEQGIVISHKFVPYIGHTVKAQLIEHPTNLGHKMKLLSTISYGSNSVLLSYKHNTPIEVEHNYIDKIEIRDNGVYRKIEFDMWTHQVYIYGRTYPLVKLNNLTIKSGQDTKTYKCQYNSLSTYFSNRDHWGNLTSFAKSGLGFFNAYVEFDPSYYGLIDGREYIDTMPTPPSSPYYKIKFQKNKMDSKRAQDPSTYGVLSKLIYPTGGYTEFEFENHWFLSRTDSDGDYQLNYKTATRGGGFRIKKITNYTADNVVADMKNIKYGQQDTSNSHIGMGCAVVDPTILTYMTCPIYAGTSNLSGEMIRDMIVGVEKPGYFYGLGYHSGEWKWECQLSSDNFRRTLNGRPSVVYPDVTVYYGEIDHYSRYSPEKTIGKTVYKYIISDSDEDTIFFEEPMFLGKVCYYQGKSHLYDKLIEKTDYCFDASFGDFRMLRKEKNEWEFIGGYEAYEYINRYTYPTDFCPMYAQVHMFMGLEPIIHANRTSLLRTKKIIMYETSNDSIWHEERYMYNSKYQLKQKNIINGNDNVILEVFDYPRLDSEYEYIEEIIPEVNQKMAQKNIIAPIVEKIIKKRISDQDEKIIYGQKTGYKELNNGYILPSEIYNLEITHSTTNYKKEMEVIEYTPAGNPRLVRQFTGTPEYTMYLWSYRDRCLIAKIENVTPRSVSTINRAIQEAFGQGGMTMDGVAELWLPDDEQIRALASNSNLNSFMVTTYTHKPGIGITSITDPRGFTTYYDYDGFGRLKESFIIENGIKKIVQSHEYNYVNQP